MAFQGTIPSKGIRARRGAWDISLLEPVETANETGEIEITFTTLFNGLRAFVFTQGGREFRLAKQSFAELSYLFSIRYIAGLDERQRVSFRGRTLEILCVENINEQDLELWLYCKEVK